jgi:hypothetical protein
MFLSSRGGGGGGGGGGVACVAENRQCVAPLPRLSSYRRDGGLSWLVLVMLVLLGGSQGVTATNKNWNKIFTCVLASCGNHSLPHPSRSLALSLSLFSPFPASNTTHTHQHRPAPPSTTPRSPPAHRTYPTATQLTSHPQVLQLP